MTALAALALAAGLALQSGPRPTAVEAPTPPPRAVERMARTPDPDDGLPPTRFASDVLAGRPLLAVTRTVSVTNLGIGTAVVRVRIEEPLLGELREPPTGDTARARRADATRPRVGDELVVFAYAGHFHEEGQDLLMLRPFRDHGRYRVGMRVDGRDKAFREKVGMARRQVQLLEVDDPDLRDALTFQVLREALGAPGAWTRAYALREFTFLARTRPDLFDAARLRSLALLARASPWPEVRQGVESVTMLAARPDGPLPADREGESSPP